MSHCSADSPPPEFTHLCPLDLLEGQGGSLARNYLAHRQTLVVLQDREQDSPTGRHIKNWSTPAPTLLNLQGPLWFSSSNPSRLQRRSCPVYSNERSAWCHPQQERPASVLHLLDLVHSASKGNALAGLLCVGSWVPDS